mmetsp:Transcript_74109/g.128546  ORF Transcript_74109/g.128546 Transcript_74109/m.128546 type:complete len:138 (+) Transcript_74109:56-469(+)
MPRSDSRSRSPPRRSRRGDSRDRGRGGRGGGGGPRKEDWGNEGTIKQLKSSGFGFIRPSSGQVDGSDLYFHAKECSKDSPFDDLQVEDLVTYSTERDDRNGKFMAINVKLVDGGSKKKKSSRDDSRDRSDSRPRKRR